MKYSMIIQWSDEDHCYVVSFPEWGSLAHTHGDTYEQAVQHGYEVLELLVERAHQNGEPLPEPQVYAGLSSCASKTAPRCGDEGGQQRDGG